MNKPDFICIGASKTGTTWLHEQFMSHDDIWVPFVKELHYFDHKEVKRWIDSVVKQSVFGTVVRSAIAKGISRAEFGWLYQYLFKERRHEDYHKLFQGRGNSLTGEITPSYAWLPEATIQEIAKAQPDCKIIYLLREPTERIWSQLNMIRKRGNKKLSNEEVYARINKRHYASSDYLSNLNNWEKHFPIENIHIAFYDELKADPISFINRIYTFLEVSPMKAASEADTLQKKTNQGVYQGFPEVIRKELTEKLIDDFYLLDQRFGNEYTQKWLSDAQIILGR